MSMSLEAAVWYSRGRALRSYFSKSLRIHITVNNLQWLCILQRTMFSHIYCWLPSVPPHPSLCINPPAHSLSSPPPPPNQEDIGSFRLETYLTEPSRPETRRLRSFSSPPDTGQCSSSSSNCFQLPPVVPPLPVRKLVSVEILMISEVYTWYYQELQPCVETPGDNSFYHFIVMWPDMQYKK